MLIVMIAEPNLFVAAAVPCASTHGLAVDGQVIYSRGVYIGRFTPAQLFAVVVVWDTKQPGRPSWRGWLTTVAHFSTSFCAADLADAQFRQWLTELPGWDPTRLTRAMEVPGLHLIWRRPIG
jgi:hypothetical protein